MDFARINTRRDAEEGATYHVEYDGEALFFDGKPIEMDFLGLESETGRRAAARMVKQLDRKSGGKRKGAKMSVDELLNAAEDSEKARAKFYAEICTGWRNVVYLEDSEIDNPDAVPQLLEFSKANAEKLFTTRPWMMEGIDAFLGDKSNFLRDIVTS